jgi:hypothetical protein
MHFTRRSALRCVVHSFRGVVEVATQLENRMSPAMGVGAQMQGGIDSLHV